jgi:GTP-binding protein
MLTIKTVNLETVVGVTTKKLPYHTWPEFAFAGKSNVGKSTLINALMNRKSYARVSEKPGKTQTINYYCINDAFYLVDLPGYGYAKAARADIKAQWGTMIENYLHTSGSLQAIFLLVDIRHDPSDNDVQMYDWIVHNGFVPIIIATKADKLKRSQLAGAVKNVEKVLRDKSLEGGDVTLRVIPFSGVTKAGRDEILSVIAGYF